MEKKNILDKRIVELSIKIRFNAAHRYSIEELDEEENKKIFGKDYSVYPHGHTYKLIVGVKGEVDIKTGMVVNFNKLEEIINEKLIRKIDKKYLNKEIDYFSKNVPTLENITYYIWSELESMLEPLRLVKVSLYEDEVKYAEIIDSL